MKIIYGREEEQKILLTYINNFIKDNQSLSLYICGVPGSGKTYTLLNTLEEYTNNCNNDDNCDNKNKSNKNKSNKNKSNKYIKNKCNSNDNNINVTYINCTSLRSKKLIFKKIYYEITKCNIKDNHYNNIIEHIEKCNNKHIIVIDEVDLLINKNYEILYNLFDIPLIVNNKDNENGDCVNDKNISSNKSNKNIKRKNNNKNITNNENTTTKINNKININKNIMLIVIANNLPEKDGKVSSRLGTNRIYFKPYSVQQLVKIFNLQSDDPFILACKRISAINGDIRKLLHLKEIMKNNTTLQQHNDKGDNRDSKSNNNDNKYKMIDKKMKDIYTPLYLFFLKSLTFNQKNIIKILCNHRRISKLKLFDEYKIILRINNNGNNDNNNNSNNDDINEDIDTATTNNTTTNNIINTVIVDKKLSDIYNIFIMNLRMLEEYKIIKYSHNNTIINFMLMNEEVIDYL